MASAISLQESRTVDRYVPAQVASNIPATPVQTRGTHNGLPLVAAEDAKRFGGEVGLTNEWYSPLGRLLRARTRDQVIGHSVVALLGLESVVVAVSTYALTALQAR